MPRDYKLYLEDIIVAIQNIEEYTKGIPISKLDENQMLLDAVLYNLEVIGEAAKHLTDELKMNYPEVEWRKIAGLRDIVAHEYFGISIDIIRDIVSNKLPPLHATIKKIIEEN